jgi:hypothetical protein
LTIAESIEIDKRFNGPLESGHGGYCSGVVAGLVDAPAEVNLRRPVPLGRSLEVVRERGGVVRLLEGEALIADGRPLEPESPVAEVPAAVSIEQARAAAEGYRGKDHGDFCRCYVCGRAREDSFEVFAGAVEGRELVASPWIPPSWIAQQDGSVPAEHVWAVLDCPTLFASYMGEELGIGFLARMRGRVDAPVRAGEEQVVVGWPIETDGRKRLAGSAVLSSAGEPLALAEVLMIEPRTE